MAAPEYQPFLIPNTAVRLYYYWGMVVQQDFGGILASQISDPKVSDWDLQYTEVDKFLYKILTPGASSMIFWCLLCTLQSLSNKYTALPWWSPNTWTSTCLFKNPMRSFHLQVEHSRKKITYMKWVRKKTENTGDHIYDLTVGASHKYKLPRKRLISLNTSELQVTVTIHVSSKSQWKHIFMIRGF